MPAFLFGDQTMQVFKDARYKAVSHILNELRNARHRVFIEVVCTVMLRDEQDQVIKANVLGLTLANSLISHIDPESGLLTLNVSQKACPALVIGNGVIMGSVSLNQMQCDFSIPIGSIVAIKDLTTQEAEMFNPFLEIDVGEEPKEETPQTKKPHLTVVK